jgi:mRNA interferase RelE/StbE
MAYTIRITGKAKKDIDDLPPVVRKRLGKKLFLVAELDDIAPVVRRLVDSKIGDYRLRIGDYRILFDLDYQIIVILRVQHRKDVYR